MRGIVGSKDRQNAVADELKHLAASGAHGLDHGRGVIVEQRNDLVGRRRVGNLRVTAQVRVPDDRADPVGDTARDAAAQHTIARVVTEIHLNQCPRDARERYAFDVKRKQRNESSQRNKIVLAKTAGARRDPRRVDAVHLADDARRTEAMNESDVVGLTLRFHLAKDREVRRVAHAHPAAELAGSGLYQMVERAALPVGRGLANIRTPVFHDFRLLDAVGSPTKRAAFVDRMQRVDDKRGTRECNACAAAAVEVGCGQTILREALLVASLLWGKRMFMSGWIRMCGDPLN